MAIAKHVILSEAKSPCRNVVIGHACIELVEMPVYGDPFDTRAASVEPYGRKRAASCVD
jgi:hypothetical protein